MEQKAGNPENNEKSIIRQIQSILKEIKYGYIQITVQDSRPVQIDKVEKFRLDKGK